VQPWIVSTRVVKTLIFSVEPATAKSTSAPSLFPIQFRCIVVMRSGQSFSVSSPSSRSWANAVMRNAHSGMIFSTTGDSQRSQRLSSTTCSFAITVWQPVHQLALPWRR
jgi:hypothetical protein